MSQPPNIDNWFGLRFIWEVAGGIIGMVWMFFKVQVKAKDAHIKVDDLRKDMDARLRDVRLDMDNGLKARDRQRHEDQTRQDKRYESIDNKLDRITNHLMNSPRNG